MKLSRMALTTGVVFGLLALVGLFSFAPNVLAANDGTPTEPDAGVTLIAPSSALGVAGSTSELEGVYQAREQLYLQQLAALNAEQQARQLTYDTQINELNSRAATLQGQLDTLTAQEEALRQQLSQINVVRVERIVAYQSQLDQATAQYGAQQSQLQARLNDAQVKLAEANAILGR